jgi:coenzyme F420-reducing hydrogenase delta subunit/Pyruvate/2-oxoacid:ferredoxin oxidoreductase delta subunit
MTIARELDIILAHGPELSAGGLDFYKLGLWAAGLHNSRILSLDPALPQEELEARLRAFLHRQGIHTVLLAALDPYRRARGIFRLLTENLQVNPELLTVLDLQEALGSPDPAACSLKAHHLIRLAATMITRAEPVTTQELPVTSQILVWGGSYAALKAAVDLADLGYTVIQAFSGPGLAPLVPGAPPNQTPEKELQELIHRTQAHPAIRQLSQASIMEVEGSAGNFRVRLQTPEGVEKEKVGALILAPELGLEPGEAAAQSVTHPRVITQSRLEEILADPQDAAALLASEASGIRVAFLGGDSHPLALGRTLSAARELLTRNNCQVFLFIRDAKVGAPDIEAALEEAQVSGLIVFKLRELPALTLSDDQVRLTFFDPVMHGEESLPCDLVVADEIYRPAADNAALAEVLHLFPGPQGFLQGDNVRFLPVITNRRGVYVAGPGRGVMDLDHALAEADAAVSEVQQLLGQGLSQAPKGRALVDRGRCVLCLTCHRLCPHGAISWDNRAFINELACQGCGVCASQCPNDAIQIRNFTDDQVVAALETLDPRLTPRIIAFMCKNSAWEAYHAAMKLGQVNLPLGFTPLKMPCAGKIDIDYLLKAFASGADGVLIMACHQDNCKSQQGNLHAQWRVERAQALLAEVGVDPRRLVFTTMAANAPQDFLAAVNQMSEFLGTLKAA